ncbi:g6027 [Coccomyxa elongata]
MGPSIPLAQCSGVRSSVPFRSIRVSEGSSVNASLDCQRLRKRSAPARQHHMQRGSSRSKLCVAAVESEKEERTAVSTPKQHKDKENPLLHSLSFGRSKGEIEHASTSGNGASGTQAEAGDGANFTAYLAPAAVVLGLGLLVGGGYVFKSQLKEFLDYFVEVVDTWGPLRYPAYGLVYAVLEVLALPAVPLTMTAGLLFGVAPGVCVVSVASTAAATVSFIIARYAARERVAELAQKNARFKAIDRAIGKNSLKVVTLLRLSPLLPLALSNYLYGLTSVDLPSYVLGSWAGMLPGTIAYVAAGSYGRALLDGSGEGLAVEPWQVAAALVFTAIALAYLGRVAKDALDEADLEEEA